MKQVFHAQKVNRRKRMTTKMLTIVASNRIFENQVQKLDVQKWLVFYWSFTYKSNINT